MMTLLDIQFQIFNFRIIFNYLQILSLLDFLDVIFRFSTSKTCYYFSIHHGYYFLSYFFNLFFFLLNSLQFSQVFLISQVSVVYLLLFLIYLLRPKSTVWVFTSTPCLLNIWFQLILLLWHPIIKVFFIKLEPMIYFSCSHT